MRGGGPLSQKWERRRPDRDGRMPWSLRHGHATWTLLRPGTREAKPHAANALSLRVAPGEDARHVVEHIRRRLLVIPEVLDHPLLDDVDLGLRHVIHDAGDEVLEFDRVALALVERANVLADDLKIPDRDTSMLEFSCILQNFGGMTWGRPAGQSRFRHSRAGGKPVALGDMAVSATRTGRSDL